jgi:hypothetical protein
MANLSLCIRTSRLCFLMPLAFRFKTDGLGGIEEWRLGHRFRNS